MQKNIGFLPAFLAGSVLLLSSGSSVAQNRPRGKAILSEMPRQEINGRYYTSGFPDDIPIGREIFQAFARIGTSVVDSYSSVFSIRDSTQAIFRLASSREASKYKKLTLSFGIADSDRAATSGTVTRLSIYKDGKFHGYRDIGLGDKNLWVIDVTNTRSLALEASCTRTVEVVFARQQGCAGIYFFEEILEQ
ncbi:MAG: hypothetical protein LH649_05090 [Pseudanabaena sp. CAN_BIN31]|nr:hypothetical protein [Pseudanabaena sp. CAN_BIN31]